MSISTILTDLSVIRESVKIKALFQLLFTMF